MGINNQKKFYPGVQHIYVRADDWGVVFYDEIDRLVFYTAQCVAKRKCGVHIVAASYMFTHVHTTAVIRDKPLMSDFVWRTTSPFARAYNCSKGHKGQVFHRRYGWASKRTAKNVRNNICYVFNNHVEKHLCVRASASRWDFLAYAKSSHPFSKEIDSPSPRLQHAMNLISKRNKKNQPLRYSHLIDMFSRLNNEESEQLTDFIISTYKLVDFDKTVKYFKGYDEMLIAPDYSTGSEYDINEEYTQAPDTSYEDMISCLKKIGIKDSVFKLDINEKSALANKLGRSTNASMSQIAKLLHISIKTGL